MAADEASTCSWVAPLVGMVSSAQLLSETVATAAIPSPKIYLLIFFILFLNEG